ncbi:hypothetical protein EXIGLDRAFT_754416 [Exidia glandulosa HHB12029]|uniref:Nuclear GTPase SLIP-GC n=1 Tax=Exidia glandulosa HHB12029 TaxID=1314781 RepID=A0A165CXZ4_EXIGL|nr:hypothetical protein EXIGLDRAFT_754416 [Exidia glandulosa HHB12029]
MKDENQPPAGVVVKPEPGLYDANLLAMPPSTPAKVKPEPIDATTPSRKPLDAYQPNQPLPGGTPKKSRIEPMPFVKYERAEDIAYAPETAMAQGLSMVRVLADSVGKLELGSKLRKDVWLREIESLKNQGVPRTLIAICGGTGTGKSSCLNAVLGDNIVPTSGMRACTAVVTEISYHDKNTIEGDVAFLSRNEWREEIKVLLSDMVDEDGNLRRLTDLKSEAGVAWSKLHAVCPTLPADRVIQMSPDQIIDRDQRVSKVLGTTKNISCSTSRAFGKEIGRYIDSKEKKKGGKKTEEEKRKENEPAFWPLIKQVRVRCKSSALETGAILVDLPGTQDANAARSSIAKDYMKRCQAIWILAPITRAVDDKTAKDLLGDAFKSQLMMDGNYASSCVTFVATKTDDISCNEIIRALNLEDEPELVVIEDEIQAANVLFKEQKKIKEVADAEIKSLGKQITAKDEWLDKVKDFLETVQAGGEIALSETIEGGKEKKEKEKKAKKGKGKKRKSSGKGKNGSSKRRKTGDDMDDFIVDEEDDDNKSESEASDADGNDSEKEVASDLELDPSSDADDSDAGADSDDSSSSAKKSKSKNKNTKRKRGSDDEGDDDDVEMHDDEDDEMRDDPEADEPEVIEYATEEHLKDEIQRLKDEIKALRARKKSTTESRKTAIAAISSSKKQLAILQRKKNCFCSKRRNEYSRDALKTDFREGLRELDEAAAQERDPDNFDPNQLLRDYDAIDLPVFTVSSRDYVRVTGQVQGDGDPTVFDGLEDTGIPALQQWTRSLTESSRLRSAQQFLRQIQTFANSVNTYVESINDVSVVDRLALRDRWASDELGSEEDEDEDMDDSDDDDVNMDLDRYRRTLLHSLGKKGFNQLYGNVAKPAPPKPKARKRNTAGKLGIMDLLINDFDVVVEDVVDDLKDKFSEGLEDKCKKGAEKASDAAVETVDNFAAAIHWATYRATLRRHGAFRSDLNAELAQPMTSSIASSWSAMFEQNLFGLFEKKGLRAIQDLLKRVEESAAPGLREKARAQTQIALKDAQGAMANIVAQVNEAMKEQQKDLSRTLAPRIQDEMIPGYDRAMEERGTGSVKRQKDYMHNFISTLRKTMFNGGADLLLDGLKTAATQIGTIMQNELDDLAKKIEVALSVLWDTASDSREQVMARRDTLDRVTEILKQLTLWSEAAAVHAAEFAAPA